MPWELSGVIPQWRWSTVWSRVPLAARTAIIVRENLTNSLCPMSMRTDQLEEGVFAVRVRLAHYEWAEIGANPRDLHTWTHRVGERGVIVRPPTEEELAWLALLRQ